MIVFDLFETPGTPEGDPRPKSSYMPVNPEKAGSQHRALGNANMGALINAINYEPKGKPAQLTFLDDRTYSIDPKYFPDIIAYYDSLPDMGKFNFMYRVLTSYNQTIKMLNHIAQMKLFEKKNKELSGKTASDAQVARELQKIRAKYPSANSDIEALVKDEFANQEKTEKNISDLKGVNRQQDELLKQITAINQQQDTEIDNLEGEERSLQQTVQQLRQANAVLAQRLTSMSQRRTEPTPAQPGVSVATDKIPLYVEPSTPQTSAPDFTPLDVGARAQVAGLKKEIDTLKSQKSMWDALLNQGEKVDPAQVKELNKSIEELQAQVKKLEKSSSVMKQLQTRKEKQSAQAGRAAMSAIAQAAGRAPAETPDAEQSAAEIPEPASGEKARKVQRPVPLSLVQTNKATAGTDTKKTRQTTATAADNAANDTLGQMASGLEENAVPRAVDPKSTLAKANLLRFVDAYMKGLNTVEIDGIGGMRPLFIKKKHIKELYSILNTLPEGESKRNLVFNLFSDPTFLSQFIYEYIIQKGAYVEPLSTPDQSLLENIPVKSVIQGYTVDYSPDTGRVTVSRGGRIIGTGTNKAGNPKYHSTLINRIINSEEEDKYPEDIDDRDVALPMRRVAEALPDKAAKELHRWKNQQTQPTASTEVVSVEPQPIPTRLSDLQSKKQRIDNLASIKQDIERLQARATRGGRMLPRGLAADLEDYFTTADIDTAYDDMMAKYQRQLGALQQYLGMRKALWSPRKDVHEIKAKELNADEENVLNQYVQDLRDPNGAPMKALKYSFPKFAKIRDALAQKYADEFGIDVEKFHNAAAVDLARQMYSKKELELKESGPETWTVHFTDGTTTRLRVPSDETDPALVRKHYANKGKTVKKFDYGFGTDSETGSEPEPHEPGSSTARSARTGERLPEADTFNRGGNNKLRDKNDYYDKREHLAKQLDTPGYSYADRQLIRDRMTQLEKAARMQGFIE
jgi:hypothetical protein